MNIVDIFILVFLLLGAFVGFKRGFIRELVHLVGIFAIIVFAFYFKNPVSIILYTKLPFFNFGGIFKDITVLNILAYEVIAFIAMVFLLTLAFKLILKITKVFEKMVFVSVLLSLPSKIFGMILGIVEAIVYSFIAIYILRLPTLNIEQVKESQVATFILDKTPVLNHVCDTTVSVFNQVVELKEEYETTNNMDDFNIKVINLMLDNKVITQENLKQLIDSGKIKNVDVNSLHINQE